MAREIKFRVWDIERSVFVNYLVMDTGKDLNSYKSWFLFEQYTGLKDKNGVEIYEGDILLYRGAKGVVYYDSDSAMFMCRFERLEIHKKEHSFDSMDEVDMEVIGNIHLNPELL